MAQVWVRVDVKTVIYRDTVQFISERVKWIRLLFIVQHSTSPTRLMLGEERELNLEHRKCG